MPPRDDRIAEIITSLRLAERAITDLLSELEDVAEAQREDHVSLVRLQEQQSAAHATSRAMLDTIERIVRGTEGHGGLQRAVQELQHGLSALNEQVERWQEEERQTRSQALTKSGNQMQALSTVIAALIGAAAGIASLIMQYYQSHGK